VPKLVFKNAPGSWHTNDFKSVFLTSVSWEHTPSSVKAFVFFRAREYRFRWVADCLWSHRSPSQNGESATH